MFWGLILWDHFHLFWNEYIFLNVDYVSKWVEVVSTRTTEARVVVKCLRENIFSRYSMPRAIIVTRVLISTIILLIHC